jgi:hypothetical protein
MLATLMMYAAMDGGRGLFSNPNDPTRLAARKKVMTEEDKKKLHRRLDSEMHEFNINGEVIVARDKKTAKKIYQNRHKK